MLDAWIIQKIKEREKKIQQDERPQIRCPVPEDYPSIEKEKETKPETERGVFVIKIGYSDDEEDA